MKTTDLGVCVRPGNFLRGICSFIFSFHHEHLFQNIFGLIGVLRPRNGLQSNYIEVKWKGWGTVWTKLRKTVTKNY